VDSSGVIILNDLRAVPILASLKLRRNMPMSTFIAHESIFWNREYADYTNIVWKTVLKYALIIFFGLRIIKSVSNNLNDNEIMGVQSSLFSITEDSGATKEIYPKVYNQIKKLAMGSKDIVEFLKTRRSSLVFIFNGRTASSYLITKYCANNSVRLFYYEYAAHCNGFRLFPVAPHASGRLGVLTYNYYRYGVYNLVNVKTAANNFRTEKLNSSFSKENKQKPSQRYDIVLFLGSDFEYTSVDPQIAEITWNGNVNFCRSVVDKYGEGLRYAIRCHPNSNKDPNWKTLFDELKYSLKDIKPSVDIYGPDVPIDSHELIRGAGRVVTDLSTISLDAIMLGKPVDVFGNTDIKYIYSDPWMKQRSGGNIHKTISEPFSLLPNFLVFRFSKVEKIVCFLLYAVHRSFDKYVIWRGPCYYKN
jgi:hypothetical protein